LRRVKLKDVCSDITVGHVGPMADEYVDEGIPFLRSQNVLPFRIDYSNLKFISEAFHKKLKKSALAPGDVVVVRTGYPGTACVIPHRLAVANCADLVIIRPSAEINGHFLACIFNSAWGRGAVAGSLVGVAQQHFNIGVAKEMEVALPAIEVQKRIASILSAYDDLIENNTRRIKILEAMAQMLYREWFVNFRFPGHEKVRMVESALGPIPKDWEARPLKEVAKVNALSLKPANAPDEIRYIDIASVSTARIEKIDTVRFTEAPGRARRIVRHGDVIWSTVRPNRRSYALVLHPESNLIVSTGFAVLTATAVSFSYLYFAVTTDVFADYLTNHATGAAYPAVTGKEFESAMILVPPDGITNRFHEIAEPTLELCSVLHRRNQTLRTTRDLLLPKLISGEVPVEAADETAAELMEEIAQPA